MPRLPLLVGSSLVMLTGSGCLEAPPAPEPEALASLTAAVVYQGTHIKVAASSSTNYPEAIGGTSSAVHENCRVPRQDLNGDGVLDVIPDRTQLLIYRGSTLRGVCTVAGSTTDNFIYMSQTGFNNRVRTGSETNETLSFPDVRSNHAGAAGADYDLPSQSTNLLSVLTSGSSHSVVEFYKPQSTPQVLYTWPHLFEGGTLPQLTFYNANPGARTWEAAWAVGFNNVEDADNKFHITSANLGASFPQLRQHLATSGTPLPYSVSFHAHGTSCSTDVKVRVGGQDGDGTEKPMHRGVAEIIRLSVKDANAFTGNARISYAWNDCFNGEGPLNFVNATNAFGKGIQLEQYYAWINADIDPSSAVKRRGEDVVSAVRSVFDCLAEPADSAQYTPSTTGYALQATTNGYATAGLCPGFIGDQALDGAGAPFEFSAGLLGCTNGGTAHVDYYRREENASGVERWRRIGGGLIEYDSSCQATKKVLNEAGQWETNATVFDPGSSDISGSAVYRAVVRAEDASGLPAPAFFTVSN